MIEDVCYGHDWRGKIAIAAKIPAPQSTAEAIDLVLQAVFLELQNFKDAHTLDEGFVPMPLGELLMNASNRLPTSLAEIVLSAGWLRSEVLPNSFELDENLRASMLQTAV